MKSIRNIKKSVLEIAQLLAQNDNIVKLLYNDHSSALLEDRPDITLNQLLNDHYICICAPIESGIRDTWRNTFLTILLDNCYLDQKDDNYMASVKIYVSTEEQFLMLDDNKNRLFELIDEIIMTLEDKKLSSAGKMTVSTFSHTMLTEFRFAYVITVSFSDQTTRKVEI